MIMLNKQNIYPHPKSKLVIKSLDLISCADNLFKPVHSFESIIACEEQVNVLSHSLPILISKRTSNNLAWSSNRVNKTDRSWCKPFT